MVQGDEPCLAGVQRELLSSEPCRFDAGHAAAARLLRPQAQIQAVDGGLLRWYGPRAVAGLRYLRVRASAPAVASPQ